MAPVMTRPRNNTKRLPLDHFFARSEQLESIKSFVLQDDEEQKTKKVVLVSGPSGVGKTTLLHRAVNSAISTSSGSNETFLLGAAKFDAQTQPLEAIQTCVDQLVKHIHTLELEIQCRQLLWEEMDSYHRNILQSIVPSTASLFNDGEKEGGTEEKKTDDGDEHIANINGKDTMVQLQLALKGFIRNLSRNARIVWILDDLQWCDQDSFDMLTAIFTDTEASNLVLCGTFRDNEMTEELETFQNTLSSPTSRHLGVHSVTVGSFSQEEVHQMMMTLLDVVADHTSATERTMEFSRLIYQRTAGNIFFIRQMLESLQHDDMITYDWMTCKWQYDSELITERTAVCDNVLQVVVQKIQRLDQNVQSMLQVCACLGSRNSVETLEVCLPSHPELTNDDLDGLLELACAENLLDDLGSGWYKFSHDKVFESVCLLLPTGHDREELHWTLGKLLWKALQGGNNQNSRLRFVCTDQINMGAKHCVSDEHERLDVAKLNFMTARSASQLSAYRPACRYCKAGIEILGDMPSSIVTLDLYVHYAEMLYCVGEMRNAKAYCNKLFASSSMEHKIPCYIVMMQILNAEGKNKEVVDFGLHALRALGEPLPKKPNKLETFLDYNKAAKLLKSRSDEDILSLPLIKDAKKTACIQIMQYMLMAVVHLAMTDLCTLIVGRTMRLTFKHGLTKWTPEAFAVAGVDIIARRDDLADGYRLGKLAAAMIDRLQARSAQVKVCFWTAPFSFSWIDPLPQCLDLCMEGYASGMRYGDVHYAFHNISCYAICYFYSGLPLKPLLDDLDKYCQQMIDYHQFMVLFCIIPCWQCALNLCGRQSSGPLDMTKGYAIDKQEIAGNEARIGEQACWSFLMQLCFYLDDFKQAAELSQRLQGLTIGLTRAEVFYPTRVFFFALSAIERFRATGNRKFKQEAKKHVEQFSKWISAGAINLVHKGLILRAEMDFLGKKDIAATRVLYDKAYVMALRTGFLQDAALAAQLAASFCEKNLPQWVADYVVKAWEQWQAWDAVVIAAHLESKYPDVFANSSSSQRIGSGSSSGYRSRSRFRSSIAKKHEELDYK